MSLLRSRMSCYMFLFFFFSSRRRHTRLQGDWSSDVCSSDLNLVRIVVNGSHVEHWLNGVKVVEYELGSPDWEAKVKASKFATHPRYGRNAEGYIGLQEHEYRVAFRNIKIRVLP